MSAARVIVADYRDGPELSADRIDRLLVVDRVHDSGTWRIRVAHPRR
jgi:hypothetical protein